MSPISLVELNNGTRIPSIDKYAFVRQYCAIAFIAEACGAAKKWILTAIEVGYRHIDTALIYGTEKVIGEAIRESGIPREEFFITTKLPFNCQDRVAESFDLSLKNLGVDYVDLYLMHWPMTIPYRGKLILNTLKSCLIPSLQDTWMDFPRDSDGSMIAVDSPTFNESYAEMEKIYASGRAKAIGVSNFSIKTRHPYLAEHDLTAYHKKKGISTEAYSPGGHRNAIREDPIINEIATKHGVSPTQVILAWHIAGGVIVIPKSENEQRQKDNINFGDDLKKIDGLDRGERLCNKIDKNGKVFGWTNEQLGW
ncbi:NADP-dependent oxidoreductase domain-containing protein [Desarmillaria ectypa]|nr:NADP-dependent oxidoreductase domain-containing protein [Desarmillaria ectypa]